MWLRVITLIMTFFLFPNGYSWAHKVNIFVYTEDGKVWAEGYFADGKKAKKSSVLVYDQNNVVIHEGKTDDTGVFSFKPSGKTDLRIVLNTGAGHQAEYTLHTSELTGMKEKDTPIAVPIPSSREKPTEKQIMSGEPKNTDLMDKETLKSVVKQAVAEASKPLARSLEEMKEKVAIREIIGGIGYIFGILGIFLYLKSKKNGSFRS